MPKIPIEYEEVLTDPVVRKAEELGMKPWAGNIHRNGGPLPRHFYWFVPRPDFMWFDFGVRHELGYFPPRGYEVRTRKGKRYTSDQTLAIAWLEALHREGSL